ncbi:hypothetical protein BO71DRAFT_381514 [Aspergillus ellipticus CBS 707.79]|uniref:Uncharacterized protein n=1 Tax=Aspergillus ellipticus CBS 707.79 TaxID=1448320 RepID=A0A319D8C1_9EURO|nr:hypothetical protein BO71DRAFT_381514 [Aspergillus ellipticus CBS 707.79]
MVEVNPVPLHGPKRPLPSYLIATLETWHRENGPEPPKCKYGGRQGSMSWKVFDRDGNQLQLSWFTVLKPRKYDVLVLHESVGTARFVYCDPPHRTPNGTYLRPWTWFRLHNADELPHCAIRMFGSSADEVIYSSDVWDYVDRRSRAHEATAALTPSDTPNDGVMTRRRLPREDSFLTDTSEEESDEEEEPEQEREQDKKKEKEKKEERSASSAPNEKKRKITATSPAATGEATPTKVVFRLASQRVMGAIRYIPLDECMSRKELFDKASAFYKACERDSQVNILACQISSQREQQYLFEDSDGEFRLLVEQAQRMTSSDAIVIDVLHVLQN